MSQQSDMADRIRTRLENEPVPASDMIREIREAWGSSHGVGAIHGFVREVGTCLLWGNDVEVGDIRNGQFVVWTIKPEEADDRICEEWMAMDEFLNDPTRYVFRKK